MVAMVKFWYESEAGIAEVVEAERRDALGDELLGWS
jgi:hypothetical protein